MFPNKATPWLLLIISVLVIVIVILANRKDPETQTTTVTEVDTLLVTNTVHTQLVKTKVVTEYDTIYVDKRPYLMAKYSGTVDTTDVSVKLDITYSEYDKLFDVAADIKANIKTEYITTTVTQTIVKEKPYPAFAPIFGMTPIFTSKDKKYSLNSMGADLGVRVNGKYDISAYGNTDKSVGLRLGVRF